MYYAHSTARSDRSDWQPLPAHLHAVAEIAAEFGRRIGLEKAVRLAGLLHDLGKYSAPFQARLAGAAERVDHSTAGAAVVRDLTAGKDRLVAELIAYAIAGHHAGLPDRIGPAGSLDERITRLDLTALDPVWRDEITLDPAGLLPGFDFAVSNTPEGRQALAFQLGLLGKMIFSCLVDADFKETESFYAAIENRTVDRAWPKLKAILPDLIETFDRKMQGLRRKEDTPVNRLRAEILDHVRRQAKCPTGLFTLTVPTGGGKTLASLGFALDHAKTHGLDRIIYAIPFTSIIDQTAAIFRDILGEKNVLEHHSAIEEDKFDPRQRPEGKDKLKLAMEDWAAPVVVTTNVQFFESLFAARPARCRKLHNIARSVIILDEAQTLPRHLLSPAMRMLDELARNYGCSIVLCTATQPAVDKRNFTPGHPAGLALEGRELAPDPARLAEALKRVTIRRVGPTNNDDLVQALSETPQGLVVVNSRKHARELFQAARQAGLDGLYHLSTRQYAAHRREILATIRRRLADRQPCRLVATSLVEAGVDLDFPRVWRAEAGLDQIAQAAGRCNREGRNPAGDSIVTVFSAPDYPPGSEIKRLVDDMATMVEAHADDLLAPAAIERFFGEVYWRMGDALDRERILDLFRIGRDGANMTDFSYRSAAEKFRMIETSIVPVIVARDGKAIEAVERLHIEAVPSGAIARDLQPYIVQVPPKARDLLLGNGHVRFAAEKLRLDQFAVLQTPSLYEDEVGLIWENAEYLDFEIIVI